MENETVSLSDWIVQLQAHGKQAFSLDEIKNAFSMNSNAAIKLGLNRLSKKGKVLSVHRGYYVIIPSQYSMMGILPAALFIDGLMQHLGRPYYVGLLSAAAFHGAAHQRPQEFFVMTGFPVLRPLIKKSIKINFISKKNIASSLLETRNTPNGYLKISSPELTAVDLVHFEKRIGGLNRASTVLIELAETIKPKRFNEALLQNTPFTTLQRLGYLLEKALNRQELADALFEKCQSMGKRFLRIPLKTSVESNGFPTDNRWKVIENIVIETDL